MTGKVNPKIVIITSAIGIIFTNDRLKELIITKPKGDNAMIIMLARYINNF